MYVLALGGAFQVTQSYGSAKSTELSWRWFRYEPRGVYHVVGPLPFVSPYVLGLCGLRVMQILREKEREGGRGA